MKIKSIPSKWIWQVGLRMDCSPYMAGGLEARVILNSLPMKKEKLIDLTLNQNGIYHAGREKRRWVSEKKFGLPFLSSSDVLLADISNAPLISKEQTISNPRLLIHKGYTLITRSGTIGKVAYARPEMDGIACSEHVMRVVPDQNKIPPGYLYAFIASKYGVPMILSGTYGSIIQSLEPEHIADLPVPRLGKKKEQEIHELVQEAAELRSEASGLTRSAILRYEMLCNFECANEQQNPLPYSVGGVMNTFENARLDAHFNSPFHREIISTIEQSETGYITVGDFASNVLEPNRFKRVQLKNSNNGVRFFGTSALFNCDPVPSYEIPIFSNKRQFKVGSKTLLVPRSGSANGIIGSVVFPIGDVAEGIVTEDAIRVTCVDYTDSMYLFIALSSYLSVVQLKHRIFGSAIPHLDVKNIKAVKILKCNWKQKDSIACLGERCVSFRNKAIKLEREAIQIIEKLLCN